MTGRRAFLALAASLAISSAYGQGKAARVGMLEVGTPDAFPLRTAAFRQGLRELGYVEGRNLVLEQRWASGRIDALPGLAADLVRLKVDVIFAPTTVSALAARSATATIPIVFAVPADPVGVKLVAGLARPGGNATGLTTANVEVIPKRLEILRELSGASTVAVLFNPDDASNALVVRSAEQAAAKLGIDLLRLPAARPADLQPAFGSLQGRRAGAVLVAAGAMMDGNRRQITELAAQARVPAVYGAREFVEAGGLVSYSASFADNYRRAAAYVDKILRGASPAELPVEQASRFDFVINLRTAKALGLKVPPGMRVRASEVIE